MKKLSILTVLCALAMLVVSALQAAPPQARIPNTSPRISPLAEVAQVVGITGISVSYGRPAVKGRTVFGELEPWGKVWRTGANDPTAITFTTDVVVEGKKLAAGTYALFTIPQKGDEWTVIFNNNYQQWGAFQYSEDEDVLRVRVRPQTAENQELFTIDFPESSGEETVLRLRWATTAIPVKIAAPMTDEALIAQARRVADQVGHIFHLWEWTGFLMQRDIVIPEMAGWADRILEANPGFYGNQLKATVLAKMDKTDEAITTAEKALARGKEELGKNQFLTQPQLDAFAETLEEWRATRLAGTR